MCVCVTNYRSAFAAHVQPRATCTGRRFGLFHLLLLDLDGFSLDAFFVVAACHLFVGGCLLCPGVGMMG